MSFLTQVWLVWNIIHAVVWIALLVSCFWIIKKPFNFKEALKESSKYYLMLRVLFMSIIFLQQLF